MHTLAAGISCTSSLLLHQAASLPAWPPYGLPRPRHPATPHRELTPPAAGGASLLWGQVHVQGQAKRLPQPGQHRYRRTSSTWQPSFMSSSTHTPTPPLPLASPPSRTVPSMRVRPDASLPSPSAHEAPDPTCYRSGLHPDVPPEPLKVAALGACMWTEGVMLRVPHPQKRRHQSQSTEPVWDKRETDLLLPLLLCGARCAGIP